MIAANFVSNSSSSTTLGTKDACIVQVVIALGLSRRALCAVMQSYFIMANLAESRALVRDEGKYCNITKVCSTIHHTKVRQKPC